MKTQKTVMSKREKVVRWASVRKNRNVKRAMKDLNQESKGSFQLLLNRLYRKGLIHYSIDGNRVQLSLTQEAYYGRKYLVV